MCGVQLLWVVLHEGKAPEVSHHSILTLALDVRHCELPTDAIPGFTRGSLWLALWLTRSSRASPFWLFKPAWSSLRLCASLCQASSQRRSTSFLPPTGTQELFGTTQGHKYLLDKTIPTMRAAAASRSRVPLLLLYPAGPLHRR